MIYEHGGFIADSATRLRSGEYRKDVYHAVTKYAAQHRLDRYQLWQHVLEDE